MICLYTNGGLSNRLRSIDSILILAEKLNQPSTVFWPINHLCGAPFSKLFEPVDQLTAEEHSEQRTEELWKRRLESIQFRFASRLGRAIYIDGEQHQSLPRSDEMLRLVRGRRDIMIRTYHTFMYPERFSEFHPLPSLAARIDECCGSFGTQTIGLHIRRGDHVQATKDNPVEAFEAKILDRLNARPETTFLLATDSAATRERLVNRFGSATILSNEPGPDLDGLSATQAAVVDLWSLSRCSEIWGSRGSSFSETAFHLSAKRLPLRFHPWPDS